MKKTLLFAVSIALSIIGNSQTISNNGAKINIDNGTTVKFTNLYNTGTNARFYYNTSIEVPGDWINVSPATFDQGTNGSVSFTGSSQQIVRSGGSAFNKLTINNSTSDNNEILLSEDMEIKTQLILSNGVINTNGNTLFFGSTATTGIGSSTSFVNGKMEKSISTPFTFPCGDVNSRDLDGNGLAPYVVWSPITLSPSASTSVNVEYLFDNVGMPDWWEHGGNMDESLHHVSDREHYRVSSTEDVTTNLTLHWNNNGHTSSEVCVHSFCDGTISNFVSEDLSVVYWNGSKWIDAGPVGTTSHNHNSGAITNSVPVSLGTPSQTFITYGSKNNENPLPIELVSMTAECFGNTIELNWSTASETNNNGFVIERSEDATSFKQIAFVKGAGNSNEMLSYNFNDNVFIKNETNYYRIKQVDFNNDCSYSQIISTFCKENSNPSPAFTIFPNPFKQNINISANELPLDKATINIYNMLGSLIYQEKVNATKGELSVSIDLKHLPPAIYVVRIISGDYIGVAKIEKR
ncbi:MAG: T9SS type A sorting domain-containing protein [Bacteroidales bacterium]|nr:T9SS type A sorting domain-containing protein [Bacteroidales bacterium]